MGIKGLNQFLIKKVPEAYVTVPITTFKNKKVAIDMSVYMYKFLHGANKVIVNQTDISKEQINQDDVFNLWIELTLKFIKKWIDYEITPVIIFDGPNIKEKQKTVNERKQSKLEKKEKIDHMMMQFKVDPNLLSLTNIFELKDLLISYVNITPESRELYKNIIKSTGVPYFESQDEAEKLCSLLCHQGYVDAVVTNDIDALVYHCPLMIKEFDEKLTIIHLDKVLTGLKMNFDTFVDLCIMCGCDYNNHMKGLGPAKAYKLLMTYGCYNNIPLSAYSELFKKLTEEQIKTAINELNYDACKELFKVKNVIVDDLNDLTIKPCCQTYKQYTSIFNN